MADGEYWVCPECGYEWSDPKDEWIKSESCELCDKVIRSINKFKLPNHQPWELKEKDDG